MPAKKLKKEETNEDVSMLDVNISEDANQQENISDASDIEKEITVDTTPIKAPNEIQKNVRIKVSKDIGFTFGKESYNFSKGNTYTVPYPVKLHLNRVGVLAPL